MAANKNGFCLSSEYLNMKTKMIWQCHKQHIWKATFNDIKNNNHWCPHCALVISKPQKEIHEILVNKFPQHNIILNDTNIINPFHLDIFLPSLMIGIEYDGEYWHYSERMVKKGALARMERKHKLCKDNGIKLLRIREKDWKVDKMMELDKIFSIINKGLINE